MKQQRLSGGWPSTAAPQRARTDLAQQLVPLAEAHARLGVGQTPSGTLAWLEERHPRAVLRYGGAVAVDLLACAGGPAPVEVRSTRAPSA